MSNQTRPAALLKTGTGEPVWEWTKETPGAWIRIAGQAHTVPKPVPSGAESQW